ncbi:putative secreted protein (Por secretion system target) [Taibaiella chishuiensis]|uniref:Putative secreted protein (Por secretion system target) n=2 Tax=Taibaiella chishuiensis TaxID=1434707 RepID=A0A2P8DC05_9BACT|nr:putative secreted protein (Por secretion system target) [Taibaiella chishuiensis]
MTDSWVVHADSLGNFINQRSFGNNKEDQIDMLYPLPGGTVLAGGRYYEPTTPGPASPGFPATSEGELDIFLTRLGPETVGIKDKLKEPLAWELFPNPPRGRLTIWNKTNDKNRSQLRITDSRGKPVFQSSFRQKQEVNTGAWLPGTYFVALQDEHGRSGTKKITIPSWNAVM